MNHRLLTAAVLSLTFGLTSVACDSTPEPMLDAGSDAGAVVMPAPETIGPVDRPAVLVAPPAHDGVTPLPALFLLHGYGANAEAQATYLGLERAAAREGFYLVLPDGTQNGRGDRFWNATPACCGFGATVDDVAYLTGLMDELEAAVPVAEGQLYFMGHSNGGFMSYRMACELSPRIAAIASLAGSDFFNETDCVPTQPVSVLQIHGSADSTILYAGVEPGYPPATDVVARWATRGGCDGTTEVGDPMDLDSSVAGSETTVLRYTTGCTAGAELWTIEGGGHIPPVTRDFTPSVLAWMRAHAR